MYLTISKRFEFSSSSKLKVTKWGNEKNQKVFGDASSGEYGHGYNYNAFLIFHGDIDSRTGMMLNVATIKKLVGSIIDERYDHKFLNFDHPTFSHILPTPENIASQLLAESIPLFKDQMAQPVACHLIDASNSSATAYADGRVERHLTIEFSAARRTCSPHLSDDENRKLFGISANTEGHGHHYRLKVSFGGTVNSEYGMLLPYEDSTKVLKSIYNDLDHQHLNSTVPWLKGKPITTESIALTILDKTKESLPVVRLKLYERPDFFIEAITNKKATCQMGIVKSFHAAHRLYSNNLSEEENLQTYGKCCNPNGHGHEYKVEATVSGDYDERSGALYDFLKLNNGLDESIEPWRFKHLEKETSDFNDQPSTGENIVSKLWERTDKKLNNQLFRLRLWETTNNRFTLRKNNPND